MNGEQVAAQLASMDTKEDVAYLTSQLTAGWTVAGIGAEAVDPVLRFMEQHQDLDFGVPGPLVHFVERFHRVGYEERLVESLRRKPVALTVWMLSRLIRGTVVAEQQEEFITELERVLLHPGADQGARDAAMFHLGKLKS